MFKHALHLAIVAGLAACSPLQDHKSDSQDLVATRGVRNYALIFGVSHGLEGVAVDKRGLVDLFRTQHPEFNFEVIAPDEPGARTILDTTAQYAAMAGADGTLLWYFSGHGAEDGTLWSNDDMVSMRDVAAAVHKGRATPLKRMLMFMDSCFSGQNVNGSASIFNVKTFGLTDPTSTTPTASSYTSYAETPLEVRNASAKALSMNTVAAMQQNGNPGAFAGTGLVAEQLLAMSASRRDQESADLGSEGGAFTTHLRKTWAALRQSHPGDATINDLATQTAEATTPEGHTPQFQAMPPTLLQEKLFVADGGTPNGVQQGPMFIHIEADPANRVNNFLFVSAPNNVVRVIVCKGPYVACAAQPRDDVPFQPLGLSANGLSINRSISSLDMAGVFGLQPFTLFGVSAQNQIVSARTILIRPR